MKAILSLPLVLLLLPACSGTVETRINGAGPGIAVSPQTYFMSSDAKVASTELRQAQIAVGEKLTALGYSTMSDGALHVEVTLSKRPAILALKTGNDQLAPAKTKKPLQRCEDQEYRIGVAITRIKDGINLYRSSASEYHCHISLSEAVPYLVAAVMTDLSAPKGSYAVKRAGRE